MNAPDNRVIRSAPLPLSQEEQARADLYALIACLMLSPPEAAFLRDIASAGPLTDRPGEPLDVAWKALCAAANADANTIHDEFEALFVGVGTPRINPYASLYLAGFMMEKPLMMLRSHLAGFGLTRSAGSGELEDHLGALCETMRLIITGEAGNGRQPLRVQNAFFERHISPWYHQCLDDIRKADDAHFYRAAADFIEVFFDIERQAFDIEASGDVPAPSWQTAASERLQ